MEKSLQSRIDEICGQFESSLRNGERPNIERQLDLIPAEARRSLFAELVRIEAHFLANSSAPCSPSDYLPRRDSFEAKIEREGYAAPRAADEPTLVPDRVAGPAAWATKAPTAAPLVADATLAATPSMPPEANQGGVPDGFSDYKIIEEIARGGMGVVYKARQISLNRVVALKMILAGRFAGTEEIQRFRAEAEAVAGLDHPHVVPVYEVGEQQGNHYFTMKFIEGGNLSSQMDELRSDPQRAVRLMSKVVSALHHAHQRGILHRDLKPANILVDDAGEPHVTDFGLARRTGVDSGLTNTGAILGTPRYMSPEQAAGKRDLTTAADIYSLGAILYELLTGRPPFAAETALDTILLVIDGELVAPSKIDRKVDRGLELIALKCLAKAPHARYGSTDVLLSDLNAWLAGEPISLRPPTVTTFLSIWLGQNVRTVAWTVIIGGLCGMLCGLSWWLATLQSGIGEQAIVYQYLKSAKQPLLAMNWTPPVWLVDLALPLAMVPMIAAPFLAVAVARPKNRTADIATGVILALVFAISLFSISAGWGPAASFSHGSGKADIRRLAQAAWSNSEVDFPLQDANSELFETYPELRGMLASQRSRALEAKIFCDQITATPIGLLMGMFVTLVGSFGSCVAGTCIAGSKIRSAGSWRRAILPYLELSGALTVLVALSVLFVLGPLAGLTAQGMIWWRFFVLLGALFAMVVASIREWNWRLRIGLALASAGALAFCLSGGQSMSEKVAESRFRAALRHVELGGIANAVPYFADAANHHPDEHYFWFVRAVAHLRTGEQAKYRSDCDEVIRRFAPFDSPVVAERTAKLLLLRPVHPSRLETALRLARQAWESGRDSQYAHWVELLAGMAAYRSGDFDAAITSLSHLEEREEFGSPFTAMSGLFLGMALHRSGEPAAGIEAWRRATNKIDDPYRSTEGWLDWMMCEIVRSEAEQSFFGLPATAEDALSPSAGT